MRLGILATGTSPDELHPQFGSYADMFVQLFEQAGESFAFEVFDVREDHFPDSALQCEGWIITGSRHGVYEQLPWMQRLMVLIKEIDQAGLPMLGICFGHQIIAQALGGQVEKSTKGWGLGLHRYQLMNTEGIIENAPTHFAINAIHQDQIVQLPCRAKVIARSDFCEYAGLVYDGPIMTFQAHPEFTALFEGALIELRRGDTFPEECSDKALTTVDAAQTDSVEVAGWMAAFLRQYRK
ncbi:MAG: gamma-glutamyl-gamma-aminobutyrate hydrolase family protein [Marinobacterium sp.]|nr:gamma-glutamyl-gamma-aminobutyrate hydrolase family protein [Marinobacterium sp.]